jgi:hypothetical protein
MGYSERAYRYVLLDAGMSVKSYLAAESSIVVSAVCSL